MGDGPAAGSLADRAYVVIRRRIVTCELAPGSALTERDLVASTGFGLNPVRRALARLDHDGLVSTRPRAGYVVAPFDARSIVELIDAWSLVGPEIVRLGLDAVDGPAGDGPARAELDALLAGWGPPEYERTEDVLRFSETSARTFEILARECGNRWLRSIFDQLWAPLSRMWVLLLRDQAGRSEMDAMAREWVTHVAGRSHAEVREHLPRLIVESGRIARGLLERR